MISLDTETSGVDLRHGAKPFLVTVCGEDGQPRFWQWNVDPLTREPQVIEADLDEVADLVLFEPCGQCCGSVVMQNGKFDVTALSQLRSSFADWNWSTTEDTLVMSHLLASNQPHDLTSLAVQYLGVDVKPFEDAVEKAVKECRQAVQQARLRLKRCKAPSLFDDGEPLAAWRIAEKGLPEMPGAKEGVWRADYWLPRAMAKHQGLPEDHPWWTATSDYACSDSAVTLALWRALRAECERRGLWAIYRAKMAAQAALCEMEARGMPTGKVELEAMRAEYVEESKTCADRCLSMAAGLGYELELPKGSSNNGSLTRFLFGTEERGGKDSVLKLPVVAWTDASRPSFNKDAVDVYKLTLDGEQLEFVKRLSAMRKRNKSLEFLDAYEHYGIENGSYSRLTLHPSLNGTGTRTTRLSCNNPNLQQVSKQETTCPECDGEGCEECGGSGEDLHSVRRIFRPAPGRELWSLDAKNIELRLPAFESGEPSLIELFERPNDPPFYGSQHLLNFSVVYDDLWRAELQAVGIDKVGLHCKKKYASGPYQWTKNGGLAMQYQCGEATADRAFHKRGGYAKLKASFVALDVLNRKWVSHAERHGWVETMPDRTVDPKRGYPLLCSRSFKGGIVPTVPLNYRVQGTAGWWMVRAMTRCQARLAEWRAEGCDGWLALTVHDELVFDLPAGRGKEPWKTNLPRVRQLQRLMEQGGRDLVPSIPTPVSVEHHAVSWAEGRSL